MVADLIINGDQSIPVLERLLDALSDEHKAGFRSPRVTLPYDLYYRAWRQAGGTLMVGDSFLISTAQGPVRVLPEL